MTQTPGVVLKSKFVLPGNSGYKNYIKYINRDEATVKETIIMDESNSDEPMFEVYYSYMSYMGDEKKDGYLFTDKQDKLNEEEKKKMTKQFSIAQKNKSPLWQDVISFDNAWLEKNSLYNAKTNQLNEVKIKQVVREAMDTMLKAEGMDRSAVWTAAIHYNTDNIHVHIATVEPIPTRPMSAYLDKKSNKMEQQYRAKRKQGTLDKMKSKIANTILDRTNERNQITDLIRGTVQNKKAQDVNMATYRKTKKLFKKALENMPSDRRQWQYSYATMSDARPYIDEIVDIYLNTYHKKEMKELNQLLDDEMNVMKEMYGENSNYNQYKETKLNDLKKRMGNAVILELKSYDKKSREDFSFKEISNQKNTFQKWQSKGQLFYAMRNLQYRLKKTHDEYKKEKNQAEFDRMLEESER